MLKDAINSYQAHAGTVKYCQTFVRLVVGNPVLFWRVLLAFQGRPAQQRALGFIVCLVDLQSPGLALVKTTRSQEIPAHANLSNFRAQPASAPLRRCSEVHLNDYIYDMMNLCRFFARAFEISATQPSSSRKLTFRNNMEAHRSNHSPECVTIPGASISARPVLPCEPALSRN